MFYLSDFLLLAKVEYQHISSAGVYLVGDGGTLLGCLLYPWDRFTLVSFCWVYMSQQVLGSGVLFKIVCLALFQRRSKGSIFASILQAAIGVLLNSSMMS